jgi:hypothetical protein
MKRSHVYFVFFGLSLLICHTALSQWPPDSASLAQPQKATSTAPRDATQDSATKASPQKPKKVWTNENLADAGGTISVVGDVRNTSKTRTTTEGKSKPDKPVDPRLIAGLRQQLDKLQAQLAEVDRQLTDLKDFSKGSAKSSGGIQRNTWAYNTSSVDEQLRTLQANRSRIRAAIDSLYDNARKNGIEPGQLR